ncbi:High cysteine membrane protein [Giardia duodenalis]|uniref:High cysteine membrane protein n=1 Tax=Giardia intestinalis (strain ATCC 50803 / WB clone C6) TaxID=184922 RepID=A8B557_GIAIC|nr:High cysteine membrane protein [Giardia intestinalis]KAE8303845.1 High cysteine membrane protein [Giardia intestinalis]|eukprot:XP_001709780.1 High cysteine protein [Giardia lamblia ATCC 50803]
MLDKSIRNNNSTILTDGFVANLTSSLLCRLDHSTARHQCLCVPPFKHIPDHGCAPAGCVSDTGFVCPHGECLYSDGEYLCKCEDGFVMLNSTCVHAQCVKNGAACNWTPKARGRTCVQNATAALACQCDEDAVPHGQLCASKKYLNTRLAGSVCTGHGECYKDACVCAEGYHRDLCDCRVRNIGAVAGVTASTAVFFGLLFLSATR